MTGKSVEFVSGPWNGSLRASEPFTNAPNIARLMTDGYLPDPVIGSGFYSRPGIFAPTDITTTGVGQAVFSCSVSGVSYNFIFVNGVMYRWSTGLTGAPVNVTPANVIIATGKFIHVALLADSLIVNDGVNKPWVATNLGGTPVTATVIEYETASTLLSRSTIDDRTLNIDGFTFTYRSGGSLGQQFTRTVTSAQALGSLGADGTIPANLWGSFLVELDTSSATVVFTPATGNDTGYASDSAARAALPARTATRWYIGSLTVRADAGFAWIAGTDALAGGTTGNQAQTTNYYAGEGNAWSAFGRPAVYTGAVFFILGLVSGVYSRTDITWCEPNQPLVGYRQDSYDNHWRLTQTGDDPLYAIVGTNEALYYARALSWGALSGAPNVNFQNTATHDRVSGNVGCVAPGTICQFLDFVYFADQIGRPWRFRVGGTPEPLWKQAREIFEDSATNATQSVVAGGAWAVLEPNLNLYICGTVPTTGSVPSSPLIFDGLTGAFMGFWTVGGGVGQDVAGVVVDSVGQSAVLFLEPANSNHPTTLVLNRLTRPSENIWTDTADIGPVFGLQGHWGGYSAKKSYQVTAVSALMEVGNAQAAVPLTGFVFTTTNRTSLPSRTPVAIGSSVDGIGRYVWTLDSNVHGRAARAQVSALAGQVHQLKLYQLTVYAVESLASIEDR